MHVWRDRLEEESDGVPHMDVHRGTVSMMPREIPPSVIAGLGSLGQPGVMG